VITKEKKMEKISVIAPVYNEEENISRFIDSVKKAVKKQFTDYEIILINDGSTDNSRQILDEEAEKNSSVKVYHFTKNNGQTAALAAGFEMCTGDLVVTMDSDLQTDPEDIYILLPYLKDYQMINGRRASREDGFAKKIQSKIGNGMRNWITDDNIQDTGCPLKLMKKEVAKSYKLFEGMHRFLPTLARLNGFKVTEVPVRHYDREYGVSKYNAFNRMFKGLKDAFAVRWMKSRMLNYQIERKEAI
jgi:glycosyltransferase involved in cell wall biosynthesis